MFLTFAVCVSHSITQALCACAAADNNEASSVLVFARTSISAGKPLLRLAQRALLHISVPSIVIAEPASRALLSIQVGPVESLPSQSYVVVRALPLSVSLDGGHSLGAGSWAVSLYALQALKANIPMGISSRSELVVSVVSADGVVLAEARTVQIIGQTAAGPLPAQTATAPPPQSLVPPQAASRPERALSREPSTEERALAERLVAQGERYFTVGDVVSARLLFRRAADWGLRRRHSGLQRLTMHRNSAAYRLRAWLPIGMRRANGMSASASWERQRRRSVLPDRADDRLRYQYHDLAGDLKKLQRRIKATEAPQKESA